MPLPQGLIVVQLLASLSTPGPVHLDSASSVCRSSRSGPSETDPARSERPASSDEPLQTVSPRLGRRRGREYRVSRVNREHRRRRPTKASRRINDVATPAKRTHEFLRSRSVRCPSGTWSRRERLPVIHDRTRGSRQVSGGGPVTIVNHDAMHDLGARHKDDGDVAVGGGESLISRSAAWSLTCVCRAECTCPRIRNVALGMWTRSGPRGDAAAGLPSLAAAATSLEAR